VRLIAREHRGAAATLNEGIGVARGEFIQLLHSDDRLRPRRIEAMLGSLVGSDAGWGYARVAPIDRCGQPCARVADSRAAAVVALQDGVMMAPTLGLSMLSGNSTICGGNLMFRKRLWETLGGFRDYRYTRDWDFCLRASLECEPVLVSELLYEYRVHAGNTIAEADNGMRDERKRMLAAFVEYANSQPAWANPFAPTLGNWGDGMLALLGATDLLREVPRAALERALSPGSRRPRGRYGASA
jgi:glycosyltransferase involved in cell wall biosynthesis